VLKRRIPELVAQYTLEPTLRDLYVEGSFDKAVMIWFFNESSVDRAKVFSIDDVEVPAELVKKHGYTPGNKQEVISLAKEVEELIGPTLQITCIADADCDRVLDSVTICDHLFLTDYTSMELYLFHPAPMRKFIGLVLQQGKVDTEQMLERYVQPLREVFLLRAALRSLDIPSGMVDFTKCLNDQGAAIEIDLAELVNRVLNKGNARNRREEVFERIKELAVAERQDCRHSIYGHDFVAMLNWEYGKVANKRGIMGETGVLHGLVGCLEYAIVIEEPLFRNCLTRCG